MARLSDGNPATTGLRQSVFSALAGRLRAHRGPIYPLHVGDTYLSPPVGAHLSDQGEAEMAGVHRYANPTGLESLRVAIAERTCARRGVQLAPEQVLITAGATGALSATVRALLAPGQRLLLLAPYWPLIRGMSVSHDLDVVDVPFYDRADDAETARELLEAAVTEGTAAVYVNWPNNPSGLVSRTSVIEAVARFAERHDLWILSDEVYEDYVFAPAQLDRAPLEAVRHRLIEVHSFSKAYGMAGNRVGYVIGPTTAVQRIGQLTTYLVYSVSTGGQLAARVALEAGDDWLAAAARQYEQTGREAATRLGLPPPQGGTFLFVDVAAALDERGMLGLLEDCLDRGLLVTPGEVFGAAYADRVRLCFTSAAPDAVLAGVEILAERLGR